MTRVAEPLSPFEPPRSCALGRPPRGIRRPQDQPASKESMMPIRIRDLLRPVEPSVCETQSLEAAKHALARAQSMHVIVRDLHDRPVGVITREDIRSSKTTMPENWARRRCAQALVLADRARGVDQRAPGPSSASFDARVGTVRFRSCVQALSAAQALCTEESDTRSANPTRSSPR